jgi:flagellar hook protein FlgE
MNDFFSNLIWRKNIMMRSLFSAVSGLKAHQTKMDVIGNNIANVNTVAFKSQSVTFSEVYYQTTQTATGPNGDTGKGGTNAKQIGLGSSVGAVSTAIATQGPSERTDNPYDLCLSGNSFFIVSNAGTTYFTRAGDFTVDEAGALVTSGGANVMGWQVDENGAIVKDKVTPLYLKSSEFTYTNPVATTGVSISGNINSGSTKDSAFTVNFYDSLGNEYQATITASLDKENAEEGITKYKLTGGSITKNGEATNLTLSCDKELEFNSTSGASIKDAMSSITMTITDPDGTNNIGSIGTSASDTTATIALDATKLTMLADATKIEGSKGINGVGAGKAVGKMTAVGIDQSGCIVASYSNGVTKTIGQIAVTTFSNPAGLEKVGENLYSATLNSGIFDGIGEDVTSTDGKITSGYLEMSNVDLANEFTTMITTQRGYQANSRIITVSDTMLEELINLKR